MIEDRRTFEQELIDREEEVRPAYLCPVCQRRCPAFGIVDVSDIEEIEGTWACSECFLNTCREKQAAADAAALEELAPWDKPLGLELKAQRNRLLDGWAWSIRADSPLTPECQAECVEWMKTLQRMTVDNPDPDAYAFPDPPELVYAPADQQ